jgi:hypothetical protein
MPSLTVPTQFGPLTLWEDDGAIVRVDWEGAGLDQTPRWIGFSARGVQPDVRDTIW